MPVLTLEIDRYPHDLFEQAALAEAPDACWWVLYTLSRREKTLMRKLLRQDVPFYGPMIPKRFRTPRGRRFTSYVPLFPNYVFIYGDEMSRFQAVSQGGVSRHMRVVDSAHLTHDLAQIWRLVEAGAPLTPEARLVPGRRVRVRTGPFRGCEGVILRRENHTRLLVAVNYLQQGASMLLEDADLEDVGPDTA